jgi:DNA-binding LytR/AlgR family response regulator
MIKVAICDDDMAEVKHIEFELGEYFRNRETMDFEISDYTDSLMLEKDAQAYNLIILDIEMGDNNGIEVAGKLREQQIFTPIIFITGYVRYAYVAYKVHPFGYISKPFVQADIKRVLDDFFDKQFETTMRPIKFKGDGQELLLMPDDIYYFLYLGKKDIIAVNVNNRISIKETFAEVFARVKELGFFMANRETIVNLKYIREITNGYTLVIYNGDKINIAQKKRHEFYDALSIHARRAHDSK